MNEYFKYSFSVKCKSLPLCLLVLLLKLFINSDSLAWYIFKDIATFAYDNFPTPSRVPLGNIIYNLCCIFQHTKI